MNLREPEGMERDRLWIPTIGLSGADDETLHALSDSCVYRAKLEVNDLNSMFDPTESGHIIDSYTKLEDAASLLESTVEMFLEIASNMRHVARELHKRDRIDG